MIDQSISRRALAPGSVPAQPGRTGTGNPRVLIPANPNVDAEIDKCLGR